MITSLFMRYLIQLAGLALIVIGFVIHDYFNQTREVRSQYIGGDDPKDDRDSPWGRIVGYFIGALGFLVFPFGVGP